MSAISVLLLPPSFQSASPSRDGRFRTRLILIAVGAGGAKFTRLAVPAGAAYYFEADSETDATNLASALNWHGVTPGTTIRNRRSMLVGEKGFRLGVCGTWGFHPGGTSE